VVIASFVTIVDLVMKAQFPGLSKSLGPFIPLIVVNCIILGRAEAFASKNGPIRSVLDALGNGVGFFIALVVMSGIREILGSRTFYGYQVLPNSFEPWLIMILPAGAFIVFGLLMGFSNMYVERKKNLEREALISQYRRVGREEITDEVLKEVGV
jgi:electron transport complex protein RnfE